MNVFIIATSHQLIQLNRAYEQFKIKPNDAIVFYMNSDGRHLDNNSMPCIPVKEFSVWAFKDIYAKPSKHKQFISHLRILKEQYPSIVLFTCQYSSDYTLLANAILAPDVFYLMDEGTASFSVAKKRNRLSSSNWRLLIKTLAYGYKIEYPKCICYYTQYELKISTFDSILKYSFSEIENEINIEDNRAIVLGTSLVELGLMDKWKYIDKLIKLNNFFKQHDIEQIDYYAHRKEDNNKLAHVKNIGWTIVNSNIPFEIRFSQMSTAPKMIVSFLSPILDTLSKQYLHTPELYIVAPLNDIHAGNNSLVYQNIYEEFKKNTKLNFLIFE